MSRIPPERVMPLEYKGIRYEGESLSPGDPTVNAGTDHVSAYDSKTGELLWDKKIYETVIDPDMEGDKQWRFIEKLTVGDEKLVVTAERGAEYIVDLNTGNVLM